jgi:hypothetical protein
VTEPPAPEPIAAEQPAPTLEPAAPAPPPPARARAVGLALRSAGRWLWQGLRRGWRWIGRHAELIQALAAVLSVWFAYRTVQDSARAAADAREASAQARAEARAESERARADAAAARAELHAAGRPYLTLPIPQLRHTAEPHPQVTLLLRNIGSRPAARIRLRAAIAHRGEAPVHADFDSGTDMPQGSELPWFDSRLFLYPSLPAVLMVRVCYHDADAAPQLQQDFAWKWDGQAFGPATLEERRLNAVWLRDCI